MARCRFLIEAGRVRCPHHLDCHLRVVIRLVTTIVAECPVFLRALIRARYWWMWTHRCKSLFPNYLGRIMIRGHPSKRALSPPLANRDAPTYTDERRRREVRPTAYPLIGLASCRKAMIRGPDAIPYGIYPSSKTSRCRFPWRVTPSARSL